MASTTAVNRPDNAEPVAKPKWYRQLYFWVIVAIVAGILVGWLAPGFGKAMEPIGTTFVTAMRMLIGPIVFLTIIGGIAGVADLKKVGVTGVKALVYFQVGTLLALGFGLLAINLIPVGEGINADASQIEVSETVGGLIEKGENQHWWQFLTHIIPESMAAAFVEGDILQIIFMAVLVGVALNALGPIAAPLLDLVQRSTKVFFKILSYIMKLAPLGAFGAMAYAIGRYGISTLTSLGSLIGLFYATSALFVIVVLGSVMAFLKLNIFKLLRYLKEELLLIIGTSTAEPALPGLMRKLEHAGVKRSVVGLVVPTGYSFNLDGAAIYLSLAAVYLAQATGTDLTTGPAARPRRRHAAHLQGCGRRRRRRVHRPGRHAVHDRDHPARRDHADLRHRQVHVRVPRGGQLHRQRRGDAVRRLVGPGRRLRPGPPRPGPRAGAGAAGRARRDHESAGRGEHRARRRVPPAPAPRAPRARSAVPGRRRGSQARTGGTHPPGARRGRRGGALTGARRPAAARW